MRKLLAIFIILIAASQSWGANFAYNETLNYRILYKWGLINKQAGTASLTLTEHGDHLKAVLVGHSASWADKFYQVRDTLLGTMDKATLRPFIYEKKAHEGNEDKHDVVRFSFVGDNVKGHCTRVVYKKGELTKDQQIELDATGTTVDMLSSFYYMRSLPFQDWKEGHGESVTIFSGKQKETLTFRYNGIQTIDIGNHRFKCYHITFVFTGDGGKKTSDNMDAWITADSRRLPVQLEGKLPVGKVKCELVI